MRQDNLILGVALKELKSFSISSFDDRLLIQKKIYLAQEKGLNLGYHYNWYIAGPYSPALTTEAYNVVPQGINEFKDYKFNDEAERIIKDVNAMSTNKPESMSESNWYELLASVHYIINKMNIPEDQVFNQLCFYKPKYKNSHQAFESALNTLRREDLI